MSITETIIKLADDLASSGTDVQDAAALIVDASSGKRLSVVRARHHFLSALADRGTDEHASSAIGILDLALERRDWLDGG